MRCRQCHLTIDSADLGDGYCPECFDNSGIKRYEFEELAGTGKAARYRCEQCGALISLP